MWDEGPAAADAAPPPRPPKEVPAHLLALAPAGALTSRRRRRRPWCASATTTATTAARRPGRRGRCGRSGAGGGAGDDPLDGAPRSRRRPPAGATVTQPATGTLCLDIDINQSSNRAALTKRETQEEIRRTTGVALLVRGRYKPPGDYSDERALHLHLEASSQEALDEARAMITEMMGPEAEAPPPPPAAGVGSSLPPGVVAAANAAAAAASDTTRPGCARSTARRCGACTPPTGQL